MYSDLWGPDLQRYVQDSSILSLLMSTVSYIMSSYADGSESRTTIYNNITVQEHAWPLITYEPWVPQEKCNFENLLFQLG
jgi:hypothetical protein